MTTIIVIVVVALVFFVAVCVVALMVWKRESEMRTDSIKAIEENLERLAYELSPELKDGENDKNANKKGSISYMESIIAESTPAGRRKRSRDPFGWVREREPIESHGRDDIEVSAEGKETEADKTTEQKIDLAETKKTNPELDSVTESEKINEEPSQVDEADSVAAESESGSESKQSDEIDIEGLADEVHGDETETSAEGEVHIKAEDISADNDSNMEKVLEELIELSKMPEIPEIDINGLDEEIKLNRDEKDVTNSVDEEVVSRTGYDIGRSGKKYTTSELEMLIKE